MGQKNNTEKLQPKDKKDKQTSIRDAVLSEWNYLLEINKGEKIISFKSKKMGVGLEKETKLFKILFYLWEFRREIKNNKPLQIGSYSSLENLTRGSGCPNTEATYQHIKRLNTRFKKEGLKIKIDGKNGKFILIINKE